MLCMPDLHVGQQFPMENVLSLVIKINQTQSAQVLSSTFVGSRGLKNNSSSKTKTYQSGGDDCLDSCLYCLI
jgi:hypothetical protein